mmetsp:Transcript_3180/g.7534  ORF Transcript_3180/g.7534 Transcript_3180/m.7534 type:complete len:603 (-) Transcript_3180:98-1906(-)
MSGEDDKGQAIGKQRRRKKGSTKKSSSGSFFPTDIVCKSGDLKRSKKSTELALLLGLAVVCLYLFGFVQLMESMPEISNKIKHYKLGGNLNLARMETTGSGSEISSNNSREMTEEENVEEKPRKEKKGKAVPPPTKASAAKDGDDIPIPVGKWPVSVKGEAQDMMVHVGDMKTLMTVPKFWSPPVHNNKQFTREQAMKIGTCAEPDPVTGSSVRGEDCPPDQRTIFIGIASYRDYQCRLTLESAFKRAANPNRVRVGVVDQVVVGEDVACDKPVKPCEEDPEQALCKYKDQVDVYTMDAPLSVGPVFARHLGYRLYRGEYYATQSDAHVSFTTNWDNDIIQQMESTHNDMAVLSTYLTDVQGSIDPDGHSLRNTRPIMCNTYYEGGPQGMHLRHGSQPERQPSIHGTPQLQPWWAAGYSFSRGHFIVNVPYDYLQSMIFQGEEMSIGIRGFSVGYDFYAPERSVCFHHYATGKNAKVRNKVKHFWENGNKYAGTGKKAMKRLLGIVHMNPEVDPSEWEHVDVDRYGLGGVRTPEQFYKIFGIDVVKKKTQGHLCQFVMEGAKMHKMFMPHLRHDGMGIDYSNIDYHWVDPNPDPDESRDEQE